MNLPQLSRGRTANVPTPGEGEMGDGGRGEREEGDGGWWER